MRWVSCVEAMLKRLSQRFTFFTSIERDTRKGEGKERDDTGICLLRTV